MISTARCRCARKTIMKKQILNKGKFSMSFELLPLNAQHTLQFKKDMQEAFQQGAV